MNYRQLENTDLFLSEITFGAWESGSWMLGGTERNEAIDAIRVLFTGRHLDSCRASTNRTPGTAIRPGKTPRQSTAN